MTDSKTINEKSLNQMRGQVRARHPWIHGSYWFVILGGFMAICVSFVLGSKAATAGAFTALPYIAAMLAIFSGMWLYRTLMTYVTAPAWAELFSHYHLQTFAGERVTVEAANWSGCLVNILFEDGFRITEHRLGELCDADGNRHFASMDWEASLENMSTIRWSVEGLPSTIRASRRPAHALPEYLLRLEDGRSVWKSLDAMLPIPEIVRS